ncbi:MAG: hypothetical protein WCI39_12705 [Gallionellaceae bacterium]
MNTSLPPYHYQHLEPPRVLKDLREERTAEIYPAQVFFVGFKISILSGDRYHHAMILADNYPQLKRGIAIEREAIVDRSLVKFTSDISVIFLRNLMMLDPALIDVTERSNINNEIQEALAKRNDDQFVVYGMIGEKQVCLLRAASRDGLSAIEMSKEKLSSENAKEFIPLELCQAHPVRFDFEEKFKLAAKRYRALMDSQYATSSYRH